MSAIRCFGMKSHGGRMIVRRRVRCTTGLAYCCEPATEGKGVYDNDSLGLTITRASTPSAQFLFRHKYWQHWAFRGIGSGLVARRGHLIYDGQKRI